MKTVIAAFAAAVLTSTLPAAAEPSLALRGISDAGGATTRTDVSSAPAPVAAPAPAKKVRVVLASPYGS